MEQMYNEKAYYTDNIANKDHDSVRKTTEKVDQYGPLEEPPERPTKTLTATCDIKDASRSEAFSFEKSKLHQLQIEGGASVDVNDENICKLKKDIMERFQTILLAFEKTASIIRVMSVMLLFMDVLEMIGMFFLLLFLSLKLVPSEQILIWIGSGLLMCLLQMFMLIKGITSTQSKDLNNHRVYMWISAVFVVLTFILIIVTGSTALLNVEIFTSYLKPDVKNALKIAQRVLLISTSIKLIFQIAFIMLERQQIHFLSRISGDEVPHTEVQNMNSQTPSTSINDGIVNR